MTEEILIPNSISVELAEETGWHIGDGSMNYYNNKGDTKGIYQLRGHIEDDKEHYENIIKPIFKLLYGLDISLRDMPSTRVHGFQIWSNKLVDFKKSLGLPLGKKFDIFIPDVFLTSEEFKIAVVRGIFDTDGCIYLQPKQGKLYPRLEISTISNKLSEQLYNILNILGLRTTVYSWANNKGNRKLAYKINIRGDKMAHKFMETIKPANPKHIRKYILFKESFK
tara:strand:- start:6840 stop:7511 length:672 start_codon:yes stop_codon:yes gene_type:complete